eukprot:snap_masked-scaffold155_size301336-processed-gene-1.3 protein:Tk03782 transcript:snap_masked-scaffold155_size301336-processed-gene-1.3-mRNA-1 annotation:"histidine kinase"
MWKAYTTKDGPNSTRSTFGNLVFPILETNRGRMALLVTLFLVLVNIFNAITTNSPKADGLNALQVEYSVILLQLKLHSIQKCANDINGVSTSNGPPSIKVLRKNQMVARFDLVCLVFFPLLFVLFTRVY